jgi:hypothetical protein
MVMTVERFDFSRQPHPRYTYYRGKEREVETMAQALALGAAEGDVEGEDSEEEEVTALPRLSAYAKRYERDRRDGRGVEKGSDWEVVGSSNVSGL